MKINRLAGAAGDVDVDVATSSLQAQAKPSVVTHAMSEAEVLAAWPKLVPGPARHKANRAGPVAYTAKNFVTPRITAGMVMRASAVDTATLAVTSSSATW